MGHGGARPNSGRKPKAEEERVNALAIKALVEKHGSEEGAFKALLDSKEPSLVKFVYEHAFGKPRDKVAVENDGQLIVKIIRGSKPIA